MSKDASKIIIFSIQEAFISLFPYFILRASLTLIGLFNTHFILVDTQNFTHLVSLFYDIFPLLLVISLSVQLSKNYNLNSADFTISSIIAFIFLSGYISISDASIVINTAKPLIFAIILPILGVLIITMVKKIFLQYIKINELLLFSWSYIYYNIFILLLYFFTSASSINNLFHSLFSVFSKLSIELQAIMHLFISHLLWLIGIHGTTSYRYTFDMTFYKQEIYENFPYETFFSTFVIFGGAGSTLSLIIAIFFVSYNKHYKNMAKISLPFSIFNINEPIIYGLPIIFNKHFIIPFIITPFFNFFLSLILLKLDMITIINPSIPWVMPPLLSGYLLTDSFLGLFWQLFLIIMGTLIYIPFVKKGDIQEHKFKEFRNKLSFDTKLNQDIQRHGYYEKQMNLLQENYKITDDLEYIISGELLLYYQPKIDLSTETVYGYEALLRLKKNGEIHPPLFLDSIEKAGLESIIDMWTVNRVAEESSKLYNREISINIYPKTLLDKHKVDYIIEKISNFNISIELLEQGFKDNISSIRNAVIKLRNSGIKIALDDYGSKESNLSILSLIPLDTIKLDMSLIRTSNSIKGAILFKENCLTLKALDIILVAEGVETQEELDLIKISKIDLVQGWYYSRALPLEDAITYDISKTHQI